MSTTSEVRLTGASSAFRTTPATMRRGPLAVSSATSTRAPSRETSNDTIRPSVGSPGTGNGVPSEAKAVSAPGELPGTVQV
jgi:hypothetical protein